jgi:uncharacterized protein (TIGR02271 family)
MATKKKSKFSGEKPSKPTVARLTEAVSQVVSENFETPSIIIPIVQEQLQVEKRQVVKGKVRLHKTVEEYLETVTLPLQSETIEVVRVPKGETVREARGSRQEGDTLILPIYEEVLVVEKQLRLVEEVHITTKRTQHDEVREVLLRQEKVRLERDGKELYVEEKVLTQTG